MTKKMLAGFLVLGLGLGVLGLEIRELEGESGGGERKQRRHEEEQSAALSDWSLQTW